MYLFKFGFLRDGAPATSADHAGCRAEMGQALRVGTFRVARSGTGRRRHRHLPRFVVLSHRCTVTEPSPKDTKLGSGGNIEVKIRAKDVKTVKHDTLRGSVASRMNVKLPLTYLGYLTTRIPWTMSCNSTEHSATLFENEMYIGINLKDILYGIELVLYLRTMMIFLDRRRRCHKSDLFYATFSTVMLMLITIWVAALAAAGQKMWLLDRNYPGGPMAYHTATSSNLYMDLGRTALMILQQMADALVIYRCRIVWGSHHVIVVPTILWLTNFGLGILVDWSSSIPGSTFFSGIIVKFGVAYYSSSALLNVTLSCMICYRLLRHARTVKQYLGNRHASPYIAIVALIVESMLPFTFSSIAFLVSYGMRSQSAVVFSFVHPIIMCVTPQMLILRVANAKAWQKDETGVPESIIRVPPSHADTSNIGSVDGSVVVTHLETLPNVHPQPGHEDDQALVWYCGVQLLALIYTLVQCWMDLVFLSVTASACKGLGFWVLLSLDMVNLSSFLASRNNLGTAVTTLAKKFRFIATNTIKGGLPPNHCSSYRDMVALTPSLWLSGSGLVNARNVPQVYAFKLILLPAGFLTVKAHTLECAWVFILMDPCNG
ncbi:hypothetical protein OG21DRAFT_1606303 [Imleria badia]|nr:hypothetical protein OG21DRAFT_1606303 [Imleria badia]